MESSDILKVDTSKFKVNLMWACLIQDPESGELFRVYYAVKTGPGLRGEFGVPNGRVQFSRIFCSCGQNEIQSVPGRECEHIKSARLLRVKELRESANLWTGDAGYRSLAAGVSDLYTKVIGSYYVGQEIPYTLTVAEALTVLAEDPEKVDINKLEKELLNSFEYIISPEVGFLIPVREVESNWESNLITGHSKLYWSIPNWKCYACGATGTEPNPSETPCVP